MFSGILVESLLLKCAILTVDVQADGSGDWSHVVVVGRLAGEGHVQVTSLHPLDVEYVSHPPVRYRLVSVIYQSVLLPPGHPRQGPPCQHTRFINNGAIFTIQSDDFMT